MSKFIQDGTGVVVSVADEKDSRFASGWKPYDGTQVSDSPDKSWKVADLKGFATEHGIDLGEATKKDDILAAIAAAKSSDEDSDDEESDGK